MKKNRLQRAVNGQWFIVALAALIGAVVFIAVYGVRVLVPTNVDWLYVGGDLSQHYIGWEFFRSSVWSLPLGVAGDLAYPHGIAITFMDSIPLFAIPAKLFSGVLPEHFQYFGWWGLFSFSAIGGLAARIMQRWTRDPFIIVATSLFLLASPVVLQRMFTHTALAGHWIILMAVYGLVWGRHWSVRKSIIFWSLVLSLSVLIHPYFLVMNLFLMTVCLAMRYVYLKNLSIELLLPLTFALLTTWIIGGFTFSNISGIDFGKSGYDVAAPFAASGWSFFDGPTDVVHSETFAYAGLGGILLVAMAGGLAFAQRSKVYKTIHKYRWRSLFIILLFIAFLLFALGPTMRVGGIVVFDYSDSIPALIEKIWAVFRVTARVMWPVYYIVMLGALFVIVRWSRNSIAARVLVIVVCVVQLIDILGSPQVQERHERFVNAGNAQYASPLQDSAWSEMIQGRKHVVYLGDLYESKFVAISQYCIKYDLTLNTGYFARKPTSAIQATIANAKEDLKNGSIASDTIYLYDQPYETATNLQTKHIDNYIVTIK